MQNLNTLFNIPSQPVELTAPQSDQIATLYKRQNSSKWQVRFKIPSGNWHAASTGQTNLDIAKSEGMKVQLQVLSRLASGESISNKTFGELAKEEINIMRRALDNARAPKTLICCQFRTTK